MIDLDERLQRSLDALADARPVATPPVASIFAAAESTHGRPRRPRRVVVAAVAGGLTIGVSGAALAGVLPGSVTAAFHRMSDWGGPCRIDKSDARLVASTRIPDGSTLQWWASSTAESDHIDEFWRKVRPDGSAHGLGSSCGPRMQATTQLALVGGTTDTDLEFWGWAPERTVSLTVELSDGSTAAVPLQSGRSFLAAYPTGAGAPFPTRVVARAADGSVIDTAPVGH